MIAAGSATACSSSRRGSTTTWCAFWRPHDRRRRPHPRPRHPGERTAGGERLTAPDRAGAVSGAGHRRPVRAAAPRRPPSGQLRSDRGEPTTVPRAAGDRATGDAATIRMCSAAAAPRWPGDAAVGDAAAGAVGCPPPDRWRLAPSGWPAVLASAVLPAATARVCHRQRRLCTVTGGGHDGGSRGSGRRGDPCQWDAHRHGAAAGHAGLRRAGCCRAHRRLCRPAGPRRRAAVRRGTSGSAPRPPARPPRGHRSRVRPRPRRRPAWRCGSRIRPRVRRAP